MKSFDLFPLLILAKRLEIATKKILRGALLKSHDWDKRG
jgi:hypothetical protein